MPAVEHFVALEGGGKGWLDYERLLAEATPDFMRPGDRRARPARDQLHQRDDVEAEGRDDHPPQRVGERRRDAGASSDDVRRPLPVDAADVPRQRLDLRVDRHRRRRDARLRPQGGRAHGLPAARRASASRCSAPRRRCSSPSRVRPTSSRATAPRGVRVLTAGARPGRAHDRAGRGRARAGPSRRSTGSPRRRRSSASASRARSTPRSRWRNGRGSRRARASSSSRRASCGSWTSAARTCRATATTIGEIVARGNVVMDGLLPRPRGDGAGLPRRLVPLGRRGGGPPGWLRGDPRPAEGRDHQRRREHLLDRGRGGAAAPSRGPGGRGRRPAAREVGGGAARLRGAGSPGATLTEEELREFARERLAGFKVPKGVTFVAELPKTATGKIQKYVLRGGRSAVAAQ